MNWEDNIQLLDKQRLFMPGLKERFTKLDRIIDTYMKFCPTDISLYIHLKYQELQDRYEKTSKEDRHAEWEVQHRNGGAGGERGQG